MKTYVALVRDHSVSMRALAKPALNDFNLTLEGIKQSAVEENQSIFATVVECGVGALAAVKVREQNVPIMSMPLISSYPTTGSGTPLWDSVGEAISQLQSVKDYDPNIAYLVMIITDGEENQSRLWSASTLKATFAQLQATDKWTFVFRVPKGAGRKLASLGIPEGNIMEWEQTSAALEASTYTTVSATASYFKARSAGKTSVDTFYADLSKVSKAEVKATMQEVTSRVRTAWVPSNATGTMIKDFCVSTFGEYDLGRAYYQLTKPETIQPQKALVVLDKKTRQYYTGPAARQMIGLPVHSHAKIRPGSMGDYELYIQSTSVNRKLMGDTTIVYM